MVTLLRFIFLSFLACSVCGNEGKNVDIVTFIDELYPTLIKTKTDIFETNQTILANVWADNSLLKLSDIETLENIFWDSYRTGRLNQRGQECVLKSTEEALKQEVFADAEFNALCNYKKYSDILEAQYTSLTTAEEAAKKLPSDFINANMWCSNNGDLPSCYLEVQKTISSKAATISSIINFATEAFLKAEEDYDRIAEECTVGAVAKLISMVSFMKDMLRLCLD